MDCTKLRCPMQTGTTTNNCNDNCPWRTYEITSDLISREAVIKMLLDLCPEETEPGSYDEYGVSCICGAVEFVKRMPAVNAAPVVHGRWHEGNAMNGHDDIYCSNCGIDATYFANGCDGIYWSNENPNYCPNCGARMDG